MMLKGIRLRWRWILIGIMGVGLLATPARLAVAAAIRNMAHLELGRMWRVLTLVPSLCPTRDAHITIR